MTPHQQANDRRTEFLRDNPDLTVHQLAKVIRLSTSHIHNLLKRNGLKAKMRVGRPGVSYPQKEI